MAACACVALAAVLAATGPTSGFQQAPLAKSVVLLLPQQSGAPIAVDVERGIREALVKGYAGPIDIRVEYLDLLDPLMTPHFDAQVALLAAKYRNTPIDIVVAHRTEALSFVLDHRDVFHDAPVVFVEVGRPSANRLTKGHENVTGALVEYDVAAMLAEALSLVPGVRHAVLSGGATEFDRELVRIFEDAVRAQPRQYEVTSLADQSLDEQLAVISKLPPDAAVFVLSYRADIEGRSQMAEEVIGRIAAAASVPTFGFAYPWLGRGIVGGTLVQFGILGERAGAMAARILNGAEASTIPYDGSPVAMKAYDARALRRWNIAESSLPAGSEVRFRPPSLWNDYRNAILAGVAVMGGQAALIALLLVERRRRQRAQAATAEAEQRYRTVADSTIDSLYWMLPDGTFRYVSPSSLEVTGYAPDELMTEPRLATEMVIPEDRRKWAEHRARAAEDGMVQSVEVRIRTKAGDTRWLDVVEGPVTGPNGEPLGLRGSARDITDRKRAEADLRTAFEEIAQLKDRLEIDNTYLRQQVARESAIEGILGSSEVMNYVTAKVRQVAPTSSTVLLLGETGVGKSQLARAVHELSPRRSRPLVTLDCAALPPSLVESELFGHERGAFTGAHTRRLGRFETANGGTLFLDEIGELPLDLQGKLLRAVQDGEFERVGSSAPVRTDVRLIAATNADLEALVRAGRFRQDLWYRLNVFPITVPPLRQRPDDVPALAAHFVGKHCRKLGRPSLEVTRAAMKWLQSRPWPGNVRELEGFIERSVIQSSGSKLDIGDEAMAAPAGEATVSGPTVAVSHQSLQDIERRHILATLERLAWRIEGPGGAAESLGLPASTLRSRMKKLNLTRRWGPPAATTVA